jgi:hypothetical protein
LQQSGAGYPRRAHRDVGEVHPAPGAGRDPAPVGDRPPLRGVHEPPDRQQKAAAQAYDRQQQALAYIRDVAVELTANPESNPILDNIRERDPQELSRQIRAAQDHLKTLVSAGTGTSTDGTLTEGGQAKLREQLMLLHALRARLNAVFREPRQASP